MDGIAQIGQGGLAPSAGAAAPDTADDDPLAAHDPARPRAAVGLDHPADAGKAQEARIDHRLAVRDRAALVAHAADIADIDAGRFQRDQGPLARRLRRLDEGDAFGFDQRKCFHDLQILSADASR
jgi:hypothetical protein